MRILLVEDDADLAGNTADYLSAVGHIVDCVDRVSGALALIETSSPDLLIVDLSLPDGDGLDLSATVRRQSSGNIPILILTARDTEADKLDGFESGADDYLVKPFSLPELAARITSLGRRARGASVSQLVTVGDLVLNRETGELHRSNRAIHLKPAAFKLLAYLMANTHRVVPREELTAMLWGDNEPETDILRVHIHAIRKAVDHGASAPLVHTVRGRGYRVFRP